MSESTVNLNDSVPYDAQQIAEEISVGEVKAPKVDVAADYEASKEFSVSEIDRTEEGEKAAVAATAPKFQLSEPEETHSEVQPTSDPADFMDMAAEVNPFAEKTISQSEGTDSETEAGSPAEFMEMAAEVNPLA